MKKQSLSWECGKSNVANLHEREGFKKENLMNDKVNKIQQEESADTKSSLRGDSGEFVINKVAQSGLVTIDLEELFVSGQRVLFDLKGWLFEELILKEKDFRDKLKNHDWKKYQDCFIAITCTADAIIPTWAFMLVATNLEPVAKKIVFGDLAKLEEEIFSEQISNFDIEQFRDQRVVIKGCSKVFVPASAYVEITSRLRPVAKSIMYGEACSTVPVYKKKD